jgi:hypothetical protein
MAPKKASCGVSTSSDKGEKLPMMQPPGGGFMGLANLSAALSLDEMLSGLEKAAPSGGQMGRAPSVADGSERGGRAPSSRGGQSMMSRRSVGTRQSTGRMSTRASSCGSRVRSVIDDNIRQQARKEAHSYGHGHPSGAASEAARRARATAEAMRDAASRVHAYRNRSENNPYVDTLHRRNPTYMDTPDSFTPRSTGSRDGSHYGGEYARTPRSHASSRASSPESNGGRSHAESTWTTRSSVCPSPRRPRGTSLGPVFCSPKSERLPMRPRSELEPRKVALGPFATVDGQRPRRITEKRRSAGTVKC